MPLAGKTKPQEVRIIGGKWKGRKLGFQNAEHLRPTLGRTRETLFNWLRPYIHGRRCLDLFTGSGILGFEALSQGAAHCVFVDNNPSTIKQIKQNAEHLQATSNCHWVKSDAFQYLAQPVSHAFDLVMLDPPFQHPDAIKRSLNALPHVDGQFIYVESNDQILLDQLGVQFNLTVRGQTRSGDAHARLFIRSAAQSLTDE